MGMIPLHSPPMLKGRTMLVQRNKVKEDRDSKKEEREDASIVTGLVTMLESVLIRRIHLGIVENLEGRRLIQILFLIITCEFT